MKNILVIDESQLFRDFLQTKLEQYGFDVTVAVNGLDGTVKLRSQVPDLVIMDFYLSRSSALEVLQKKNADPNAKDVPVIMASNRIERDNIVQIAPYNVKKFFTKPIKLDQLLASISDILGVEVKVDTTPCIIEAHFNDQILFIEVAQGLNSDKISLLKYKIQELLDLYRVPTPKVLVMMSSIEISRDETGKLGLLLNTILDRTGVKPKQLKILTANEQVRIFVEQRKEYTGIEVTDTLEKAMDGLLGRKAGSYVDRESNTVQKEFLNASAPKSGKEESINLRFGGENTVSDDVTSVPDISGSASVAVVDDDMVIQELIKTVFEDTNVSVTTYDDGADFVADPKGLENDLVFLDLMMPKKDGFAVLSELQGKEGVPPVIVLSALSQREAVVKALKLGVKSYLIKPLKPEHVIRKATEVLRSNF
ncbi:MAG: response regulator [Spirochaetaceae bacterium]